MPKSQDTFLVKRKRDQTTLTILHESRATIGFWSYDELSQPFAYKKIDVILTSWVRLGDAVGVNGFRAPRLAVRRLGGHVEGWHRWRRQTGNGAVDRLS